MNANVYNMKGDVVREQELPAVIFGVAVNDRVVQRAIRTQQAAARAPIAHTKTRSEVRGGGRKPWRQKGTGRARHGSIRSPIWVGGGVTFGPRNTRSFTIRMNKRERRAALAMCLSAKAHDGKIALVDDLKLDAIKTKAVAALAKALPFGRKKTLIVQTKPDSVITKSARNIPNITTIGLNSLNVVDVLKADHVLFPVNALEPLVARWKS